MLESQRLASFAVCNVLSGQSLTETLQATWRRNPRLTPQQRAAIQDLSYGTLRFSGQLHAILAQLLEKPLSDDRLRCLLLVGLYQLQYGKAPAHAVVDQAVNAAASLGKNAAKGLVNAVLRNFLRNRENLLREAADTETGRYSHPQWWIDRIRTQYPRDFEFILGANNQHPPMTLRVNLRKTTTADYQALLGESGIDSETIGNVAVMLREPVRVEKLPGFGEGLASVQDLAAQWAAPLLDAHDGMRVLDACCAPGGKTAHLLELAELELTALDNDPTRLVRVSENLSRLGLSARIVHGDAAQPAAWWDGGLFDRILADVPCSASGVARRHPDIKWLRREADIFQYAAQQRSILDALWRCLSRDGKLLYATCSVFAEENQLVIADFLERHQDAQRLPLSGVEAPGGQLLPNPLHDGFFYCLLGKV